MEACWCGVPCLLGEHIEGLSLKAHGPSSLCVDLVNYLGCQGPTTAYPLREGGGVGHGCGRCGGWGVVGAAWL